MTKAEVLKNQIMAVRDSGVVNMLDVRRVHILAARCCFWSLVGFIDLNKNGYVNFIMTGDDKYLS